MPPLHPALVHFPLALFPVGVLLDVLGRLLRRQDMARAGWWLQLGGTIGLALAIGTGLIAKEAAMPLPPSAADILSLHEQLAFSAGGTLFLLFLWRAAGRGALPSGRENTFLALYLVGVSLLLVAGWLGGDLVFNFGVGVSR
jgi:uncharacterized membrane protein